MHNLLYSSHLTSAAKWGIPRQFHAQLHKVAVMPILQPFNVHFPVCAYAACRSNIVIPTRRSNNPLQTTTPKEHKHCFPPPFQFPTHFDTSNSFAYYRARVTRETEKGVSKQKPKESEYACVDDKVDCNFRMMRRIRSKSFFLAVSFSSHLITSHSRVPCSDSNNLQKKSLTIS